MKSWTRSKSLYPILLFTIAFTHLCFLFYTISVFEPIRKVSPELPPLVVKVIHEAVMKSRQVVQSEDSESNEKRENAYLGEKDRSFERETRARNIDVFKKSALGAATVRKSPPAKTLDFSDLRAAGSQNPYKVAAKQYIDKKNGLTQGDPTTRGLSSTNDHVENVPLGDFTHLNTIEYKYYGFYHRIRQKLEQFWGRSIQEKAEILAKGGRRVPASDELITSLQITLNHLGEVVGIKIKASSGVKELDDAAVESFNEAGPFPNPPKDLIVDGKVTIEWGFVVKS